MTSFYAASEKANESQEKDPTIPAQRHLLGLQEVSQVVHLGTKGSERRLRRISPADPPPAPRAQELAP